MQAAKFHNFITLQIFIESFSAFFHWLTY